MERKAMGHGKTILIIDRAKDVREFCRLVLEPRGYRVVAAASGKEGQRLASSESLDLVVLDIAKEEAEAGMKLATWFSLTLPGVPLMLLSWALDLSSVPADVRLGKPLTHQVLIDNVRALTGPQRPSCI